MLQQLAGATGAQAWVIAAMFLFITVFGVVVVRVLRMGDDTARRCARLPLDDQGRSTGEVTPSAERPGEES